VTGRLEGKVAVVTGAASGIGAGMARRFVAEGASVVLADVQEERGRQVAAGLGPATRFVRADVTEESDVAAVVDLAVAEFGRLDCMCSNAGIVGAVGPIAETTVEAWDRTVAVLLRSAFLGTKHAARVMVPQGSGVILNTASTAGVVGGLGPHAYTACKHAVIGLTRSAASELARHGIRVNAVAPGNTVTAMTASAFGGDPDDLAPTEERIRAMSPLGIAGTPEDIAAAAVYLASDDARYVTGHCLLVDAGQTAVGGPGGFHRAPPAVLREAGIRE
jgi:NAD(P)-dependent dehydrogenase (short-subunit alcohol dehydrogenase family)